MNKVKYTKVFGNYCFYIQDFKEKSCAMMINSNDKITSLQLHELYENIYILNHIKDEEFSNHLDNVLKQDFSYAVVAFTKDNKDHYFPIFKFIEDTENFISIAINIKKSLRNTITGAHLSSHVKYGN